MTGTSSARSRMFSDFDTYKNEEWIRRRKLRIEQVRKQSSEIAKALRRKATDEARAKAFELEQISQARFKYWKAEKLDEMERKLRCALEEFGLGHKLAEAEPDPNEVIQMRNEVNLSRAQRRGELAEQEELRRKQLEEEKKLSPIQRKKMTRKLEDLRSALIRSVSSHKQLLNVREEDEALMPDSESDGTVPEKITVLRKKVFKPLKGQEEPILYKKVIIRQPGKKSSCKSKCCNSQCSCETFKTCPSINEAPKVVEGAQSHALETVWINLNEIKTPSVTDSGGRSRSTMRVFSGVKPQKGKSGSTVEFYDYPSRYYCKSHKNVDKLVERIDPQQQPDAAELAKNEEENELREAKKKQKAELTSLERGNEALRRERIAQDYNKLIAKLEDLHKKEKIIKAQQNIPPAEVHMNEHRQIERIRAKQRLMDSKFESIYYEATAGVPSLGPVPQVIMEDNPRQSAGGDYVIPHDGIPTKLSFSPSNIKNNTPVSPSGSPRRALVKTTTRKSKKGKTKKKHKLLSEIDKTLKEGRELREAVSHFRGSSADVSDICYEKSSLSSEVETTSPMNQIQSLPCDNRNEEVSSLQENQQIKVVTSQDRESQTEDFQVREIFLENESVIEPLHVDVGTRVEEYSIPPSTATSYKSPPSVITSSRLRQFIDYLEGLSEGEEHALLYSSPKFKRKIQKVLNSLLYEGNQSGFKKKATDVTKKRLTNPVLEYYILKLLGMSRECVANLSVSSENISTPNITDLDIRNEHETDLNLTGSECSTKPPCKGDDSVRKTRLKRAEELDKAIKNWKSILEKHLVETNKPAIEQEDEPDYPRPKEDVTFHQEDLSSSKPFEEDKEILTVKEPDVVVLYSPRNKSKYENITRKCSQRISELSSMLDKVRKDKEKLLNSTSGSSNVSYGKNGKISKKSSKKEECNLEMPPRDEVQTSNVHSPVLEGFINRYNLRKPNENASTIALADSLSNQEANELAATSVESIPDVMDELLRREILTSPFKWSDGEYSAGINANTDQQTSPRSIKSVIGNFRKEMSKIKPFSGTHIDSKTEYLSTLDEIHQETLRNSKRSPRMENFSPDTYRVGFASVETQPTVDFYRFSHQEDSSIESINHALTSLGLNWAKSFLRKNEESKAISSSSSCSSEGKRSMEEEEDDY